ncbi:RidA family protein [Marinobacter sp. ELB17]|uniref:RidA family protein n=1 Tax=Marinobacter sp. ELB17 TaxID=270374 RepID=UPI001D0D691D|nr:RidA family protein [Marinobacter sp. ELB17]
MTVGTVPIRVEPDVLSAFANGQGHCVGNLLFLSGKASINDAGEVVGPGDIVAQIEQAMLSIKRALESAGSGVEHIMAMRHRYFSEPWPPDPTNFPKKGFIREKNNTGIPAGHCQPSGCRLRNTTVRR